MEAFGKCAGGGRRSAARAAAPLTVVLTTFNDTRRASLVDLSCTGARLCGSNLPSAGEDLDIRIDSVRAFGSVIWSDRGQCGIAFESPLMPFEVDGLRRQANLSSLCGLSAEDRLALEHWLVGASR